MKKIGQEGIALVKILFFTTILLLVAAFAARGTRFEVRIAQNDNLQRQALAIAEAGLDHAWRQIETDLAGGSTLANEVSGSGTGFWGVGSAGSGTYSGYRVGPTLGNGSYYMKVTNNSDDAGPGETDGLAVITAFG